MIRNLFGKFFAGIQKDMPYLVIVRHGQSIWNKSKRWAGWTDVRLSIQGIKDAEQCGILLKSYTSVLTRAIQSYNCICDKMDLHYIPVTKTWRLNQKHYGILEGQHKYQITQKYGVDVVNQWRRSMHIRPPSLLLSDGRHPRFDVRYKNVHQSQLPTSQCLNDVIARVYPLWQNQLSRKIKQGKKILIISHGSILRAFLKIFFNKNDQILRNFNTPNGIPILVKFDQNGNPLNFELLGDLTKISQNMKKIEDQILKA